MGELVGALQGSAAANDAGTTVWPPLVWPQHVTTPPADVAHVWSFPAATATWPPAATDAGTFV